MSHERGGGFADGLMADVRIAIRRTSLCAPKGSHILPRNAANAAVWQIIAAAFSRSNYANFAGICHAAFAAERCPPIPFCINFCTEKIECVPISPKIVSIFFYKMTRIFFIIKLCNLRYCFHINRYQKCVILPQIQNQYHQRQYRNFLFSTPHFQKWHC